MKHHLLSLTILAACALTPLLSGCGAKEDATVVKPSDKELSIPLSADGTVRLELVKLPNGMWFGKTEVTQAQWDAFEGPNSSDSLCRGPNYPVNNISPGEINAGFLCILNRDPRFERYGLTFRLPFETEWVYASKAGSSGIFCKLADGTEITEDTRGEVSWSKMNSGGTLHRVATRKPNAFGLFDTMGNVGEFVLPNDYHQLPQPKYLVVKGGTAGDGGPSEPEAVSSISRMWCEDGSSFRHPGIGFRVCAVAATSASVAVEAAEIAAPEAAEATEMAAPTGGSDTGTMTIEILPGVTLEMVRCPNGLWFGKYEVTQAQWKAVERTNPSWVKGADNPVETVSWEDCKWFLIHLNALPSVKKSGLTLRLPTEEEWEYACRAESTGNYCRLADGTEIKRSTLGQVAWFQNNSHDMARPVGQKQPNAFGLYDMLGNVWEWTSTVGGEFIDGDLYVNRGGCWWTSAEYCESSARDCDAPIVAKRSLGLRLCADPRPAEPEAETARKLAAAKMKEREEREAAERKAREEAERREREEREAAERKAREEAERREREAREAAERKAKAFEEACESGETMAVLMRDFPIRTALMYVGVTNTLDMGKAVQAMTAFAAASNRLTHVEVGPSAFTTEVADSKGRTMPLRNGYFFGKNDNVRFLRVKENVAKLPDLTSVFPKGRQLRVVVLSGGATDVSHARFDAFPDLREIRIPSDSPLRDEDFGNLPASCRIVRIPPEEAERSILPDPKPYSPAELEARKAEEREAERRMAYYHWSPLLAGRNPGNKGRQYAKYGAAGGAAAAMIRALRWLAVRQNADGSWGKDGNPALTSTAALIFLAQGESLEPLDGQSVDSGEFGPSLSRAVAFLTDAAAREAEAPVHEASALMAFALAEATDHTPSEKVRDAALAALRALLRDQGADGAWRTGGRADDALTGWCIQALAVAKATGRGGDLPGLDAAIDRAKVWTKTRSDSPEGVAVRAFCARLLGVDGAPSAAQTLDPLDARLPQLDAKWADGGNTGSVPRPLLVWYYDTYARFFEGGGAFSSWNRRLLQGMMTNLLIVKGDECGYKDTRGTFRDIGFWKSPSSAEWNPGRPEDADLAATCLCALQLAVYYRYEPDAVR